MTSPTRPTSTARLQGRVRGTSKLARADREQLVLDAAAEEFGAAGFAGASLSAIGDRAGVSKALVLSYFGSKEELYVRCADRAGTGLAAAIEAVIGVPRPPAEMAVATLASIFSFLEPRPQDWNVLNDRTAPAGVGADTARRHRRTIARQASRGIDSLSELDGLEDAHDVQVVTELWMGAVSSVVNWWLRHPDETAADMVARCERIIAVVFARPETS